MPGTKESMAVTPFCEPGSYRLDRCDLGMGVETAPEAPTKEPETKPERRDPPVQPSTPIQPFTPPPESEPGRVPSCPPGKHYPTCILE